MISKFKYEYLLTFVAILWILLFSYILQLKCDYTLENDEGGYLFAAKKLYLNLKVDEGRPLIIAAINGFPLLFGYSENYIFKWSGIINLLCWFSTIFLIYKIAIKKTDIKNSILISLLFMFCIGNLAITYQLLAESIFIFMIVLSVFLMDKYLTTNKIIYLTLTISLLFVSILVKPISLGLVLILILFYLKKIKEILFNKFSFLIIFSLTLLLFQMYSLKKDYGNFTVSYIDSFTYYNYLGTKADCLKKDTEFIEGKNKRYKYFSKLSSSEQRKVANEDFKNQLTNNSINLLKAYLSNFYLNSSKGSASVHQTKNLNNTVYFNFFQFIFKGISKLQNILFTSIGIILSLSYILKWKRQKKIFIMLSFLIIYIISISAISSDQGDRFHIVLYPLVILLLLNTKFFKNKSTSIL